MYRSGITSPGGISVKRPIFFSIICLFCTLVNLDAAYAQKVVQSEDTASVHKGFVDIARDRAIDDAQRRAAEKGVAVMISNETLVENFEIICAIMVLLLRQKKCTKFSLQERVQYGA
jgi:hypothetical protein